MNVFLNKNQVGQFYRRYKGSPGDGGLSCRDHIIIFGTLYDLYRMKKVKGHTCHWGLHGGAHNIPLFESSRVSSNLICRSMSQFTHLYTCMYKERQTGTKLPVPKNAKPRQHGFEDP